MKENNQAVYKRGSAINGEYYDIRHMRKMADQEMVTFKDYLISKADAFPKYLNLHIEALDAPEGMEEEVGKVLFSFQMFSAALQVLRGMGVMTTARMQELADQFMDEIKVRDTEGETMDDIEEYDLEEEDFED